MSKIEFSGFSFNIFDVIDTTIPAYVIFGAGLLIIAGMIYYYIKHRRFKSATIKYSDIRIVKRAARTSRQRYRFLLLVLRILAVGLFIVAFARPRSGTEYQEVTSEGIDIMLALDVSSSMQAEDFKPHNRLYVAKEEVRRKISNRTTGCMWPRRKSKNSSIAVSTTVSVWWSLPVIHIPSAP